MKRSAELQPLSRDHHQALYASLRLRRAAKDDESDAAEAFLEFWHGHGQAHFRIEEEVLLPGFVLGGGDPADRRVTRVLTDHVEIRSRARRVATAELEELHDLGERLAAHVRLEEEELFPLIERTLDPASLAALGRELETAERA